MALILVIEDDENIRSNITEILEYQGYSVQTAENGLMGLQAVLNMLPDLIICDIMMPEMDGISVLNELRKQPKTQKIPFIFLTAMADRASIRHGMNLGADDYITKPYTSVELLAAVTARLGKSETIENLHQQNLEELRVSLISMLPHELRTPLVGILGYGELMRLDAENLDQSEIRQMGEVIASEGRRLQHVLENYFLYAQIELARYNPGASQDFTQGEIEMPALLIRDVAFAKATKFNRENDLWIQVADTTIRISLQSLWKIVEELVENAFKFSPSGTQVKIIANANADDRTYCLQISDQGRGMTFDQIKRIGAYVQFERERYEQQGLGMGLIVAKRLIELCGGNLTIFSQPEQGTTISVKFPLAI